ncbi:lycopene beta-cyclase CrtY [Devosia rhizoryzae]|uniref:Lycopene beta-cyclase CrtY n=1 Tax=Devosia rhizoryzae TaxID=2774137 RepID=A0ABX7C353_9HYPH|nr:lycopene beta-cyclase CrtY [Devosia rhizoryzae]QQR38633.1 lycopene beta-cyclase CrtY [Devosia rhizoryzae]
MPQQEGQTLILVGAGLASALIAQRLSHAGTGPRIIMLEGSDLPFGEHTWSFHDHDVETEDFAWLTPLIAHRWMGQSVRFQNLQRHLTSGYASLTSASVAAAMAKLPNVDIRPDARVERVAAGRVFLVDETEIAASCVIDCRGFQPSDALVLGYQKFVGLEVELKAPHGLVDPVIMDASVDQEDGYRFVYSLPFSPTRVLIEDTRYADGEALDQSELVEAVKRYATAQNWVIGSIVRTEHGVLPIALAHDFESFWQLRPVDVPQAGMRAGLFHPTTGYSLPEAVRVANLVASRWPLASAALAKAIREHAAKRHRQQSFYRLLNRMLFRAAQPERRHLVLERFYKLPQPLIERFYAGRSTAGDIARILVGKPPVPVHRALAVLREAPLLKARHS